MQLGNTIVASREYEFPQVISNSLISAYKSCPLKAFYSGIKRLKAKGENVHLNAGKAYADALDTFRQYYYSGACDFDTACMMGAEHLICSYGEYEPPLGKEGKAWDRVLSAYLYYLDVYHPEKDVLQPHMLNGKVSSEFSFAEPLHEELVHPDTGLPILYSGRFDAVMEMGGPNNLFGYDDKTTARLGQTWVDQWQLSSQFAGYSWGASQYGLNLQGTIVRGISILKSGHGHAQALVYHPQYAIDRWYASTVDTVFRMLEDYKRGYWNSNLGKECSLFYKCEFLPLCDSPAPEEWLASEYEPNNWDPVLGKDVNPDGHVQS